MLRTMNLAQSIILFVLILQLSGCAQGDRKATPDELFLSAQQLQQEEKFDESIKIYRKIAMKYPETRQGANSQFMIGYIFANHLSDTSTARVELNRFLDEFSSIADSGLIEGAKFELQFMGKNIDEIPGLSDLGQADEEVDTDTAQK